MTLPPECPVCRHPLPWTFVLRPAWSQWRCVVCGSLLAINARRRFLMLIPFVAVLLLIPLLATATGIPPLWAMVVVTLLAVIPIVLQPPRVRERCGLRCKTCGYDLHGQVVPRCPECGRDLDPEERGFLETGAYPTPPGRDRPRRWAILLLILLIALGLTVAVGLYKTTRFAPRPAPPSTQPAPPGATAGGA